VAKYKPYCKGQGLLAPVYLDKQIQRGTFEFTLNHLIDNSLDLSIFNDRYNNDETGAPAYDPKILLKIILFAYSRGITSSRKIEQACKENMVFMALSANTRPHFTTIADFISTMNKEISHLFLEVLMVCDQEGLIGREMFAIDGCKLPSNASKQWSGTRKDFKKKAIKMEKAIGRMLKAHRENDHLQTDKEIVARDEKYINKINKQAQKIRKWMAENNDKIGRQGTPIKSNITDNDSAKMKTSSGVIQGYNGVTAVDGENQVIVAAEAFGQGNEQDLLEPMVEETKENFKKLGDDDVFKSAKLTADSGFHSDDNMKMLAENEIDGYVADTQFRKRDPRFADYDRFKARSREERSRIEGRSGLFKTEDFTFPEDLSHCICPAGKRLNRSCTYTDRKGFLSVRFKGPVSACRPCHLRSKCLKHPDCTPIRQVAYFYGKTEAKQNSFTEKMKRKIDSTIGRMIYGMRLAIGEPPFANIKSAIGLDRFSLRGKKKVDTQWKLFCIVHNLGKIQRYGPSFA
jgi:transposase